MKICIDPGHSGPCEPGACAGGVTEAKVVLQVAKRLRCMLEQAGHKVKLTREDDVEDQLLTWRVELAWQFRSDIFVSIHCNSFGDEKAHGTETWYFPGSDNGRNLARCIQGAVVKTCQTFDRGVKTNNQWTVLVETSCPAVLVELAFISNDKEREMLTDRFLQRQFAAGIASGIEAFSQGGPLFGGVAERPATHVIRASPKRVDGFLHSGVY